jgi:hypothetical protein
MSCLRFQHETVSLEDPLVVHPRNSRGRVLRAHIDLCRLSTLNDLPLTPTVAATKRLFMDSDLPLCRASGSNDSIGELPGRCPPQHHAVLTARNGERPVWTRGPDVPRCGATAFIGSAAPLVRASVPNSSVSEVPGDGQLARRACSIHKVLRSQQAGHSYPPRLARINRDLPHRDSLAVKGDVMIRRPGLVAEPAGSE